MTMAAQLKNALATILNMGGTNVELHAPDGTLKGVHLGAFVNWTTEDEAVRNDYDKEAQKFYLETSTPPPEKQDYLLQAGTRWTVLDVHNRMISGEIICHVLVVRK